MRHAVDEDGIEVDALLLSSSRRRFFCKICGSPVMFRGGDVREHHFAHLQESPECEEYHASDGAVGLQNIRAQIRSQLQLYVVLKELPYRNQSTWELSLRIPPAIEDKGEAVLYTGFGNMSVPLSILSKKPVYVSVKPGLETYQVRLRNVTDQYFARKVQPLCEGLSKGLITAFRFSLGPCRRLPSEEPVFWGRRYIFVSHGEFDSSFPQFVRRASIGLLNGFSGAIVELPPWLELSEDQRQIVASFIRRRLNREIEIPPPRLTLLTPHIGFDEDDAAFLIDEHAPLLIGVMNERGGDLVGNIVLHDRSGRRLYAQELRVRPPVVLSEEETLPFYDYTLSENRFEGLSVKRMKPTLSPTKLDVWCIFSPSGSLLEERTLCEPKSVASKFNAVLDSTLNLKSISTVEGTPIEVLSGPTLGMLTKIERFVFLEDGEWLGANRTKGHLLAEKVQNLIRSMQALEVRFANHTAISFGPRGTEKKIGVSTVRSVDHQALRAGAIWLFNRAGLDSSIKPNTSTNEVLTAFMQTRDWPAQLMPRVRHMQMSIKRHWPELFQVSDLSGGQ